MVALSRSVGGQLPLFVIVSADDTHLREAADVAWYSLVVDLEWEPLRDVAAQYYEALWLFNQCQAEERLRRAEQNEPPEPNPETRKQATLRLVAERATENGEAPVLVPTPPRLDVLHVRAESLRPGVVPERLAGRRPKCFFAMAKAFLAMALRGRAAEAEVVHEELCSNPSFARACDFTLPLTGPDGRRVYRQSDIPSLRKLEQFDQIMSENGLWGEVKLDQVRRNLKSGKLKIESTVVHDTTHHVAHSKRRAVELESETEGADPRRKSHPRTTKRCRCPDRENCSHAWESADEGAGTVVKHGGVRHWAHKSSTLSFANQMVPLDAVAMTDAATYDSRSVVPHLERIFEQLPELRGKVTRLLDDTAADSKALKKQVRKDFDIQLVTDVNPRTRAALTKDLPRGIKHVTPRGVPVCEAGVPMEFRTSRRTTGHFIFQAPDGADGEPVCTGCPLKARCCNSGGRRRQASISAERLHWLDPDMPAVGRRHMQVIANRTVIERAHNLMKYVYGESRLRRRGHAATQATLDKTLWAMHVALAGT